MGHDYIRWRKIQERTVRIVLCIFKTSDYSILSVSNVNKRNKRLQSKRNISKGKTIDTSIFEVSNIYSVSILVANIVLTASTNSLCALPSAGFSKLWSPSTNFKAIALGPIEYTILSTNPSLSIAGGTY